MDKKVALIVIDAEFTSFDIQGGDMINLGAAEVYEDNTIGRAFECFLKPRSTKYFTDGAQDIHGISYFKATTFPERHESMLSFLHWLKPLQDQFRIPIAWYGSWNFDYKWLETTMQDVGLKESIDKVFDGNKECQINIMKMAKDNLQHIQDNWVTNKTGKKVNSKFTLSNVAKFYGLDHEHHSAKSDAIVTAQIYCNIMNNINTWSGKLI